MTWIEEMFKGATGGPIEALGKTIKEVASIWKGDPLELAKLTQAAQSVQASIDMAISQAQGKVNELEAQSQDKFVTRWRPAVGWACVGGFVYQVSFRPIAQSIVMFWYPNYQMVTLEIDSLMTLLFGMLGLGAYRTYEKVSK